MALNLKGITVYMNWKPEEEMLTLSKPRFVIQTLI